MNIIKIGKYISERRKMLGLTQKQIAEQLFVTEQAVSKWESGCSCPKTDYLGQLADILQCSISDLLNGYIQQNDYSSFKKTDLSTEKNSNFDYHANNQSINFDFSSTTVVSPLLFGNNLEHTRNCIHKGLSAQMLENRKFVGKPSSDSGCGAGWSTFGTGYFTYDIPYTKHADDYHMHRRLECNSQRITNFDGLPCGIFQNGIHVEKNTDYLFEIVAKSNENCSLNILLKNENGKILENKTIAIQKNADYKEFCLTLKSECESEKATLHISLCSIATVWIGAVSLMKSDNFYGMKYDVIKCMKEMGISVLRWPGGNFAGEYNWKDGLIDRNMRAPFESYLGIETQPGSFGYDFHEIGIDEFVALCREIGAEPYITINPSWNTPQESGEWVEYCNGDKSTKYGALRAQRGHEAPYRVRFWSLGNEFGYGHMEGDNTPSGYSRNVARHAEMMLKCDENLVLCSSGNYPNKEWIKYSAKPLSNLTSMVSVHHYSKFPDFLCPKNYEEALKAFMDEVDVNFEMLCEMKEDISETNLKIAFDEWNSWYAWYRPQSVADGLFAARMMHMLISNAENLGIEIACHFEAVNEGAVVADNKGAYLTPMGQMISLMKLHSGNKLICSDKYFIATEKDNKIYITLINDKFNEYKEYLLPLENKIHESKLYYGKSVLPHTDFTVCVPDIGCNDKNNIISMPPCSVALVVMEK